MLTCYSKFIYEIFLITKIRLLMESFMASRIIINSFNFMYHLSYLNINFIYKNKKKIVFSTSTAIDLALNPLMLC